VIDVRQTGPAFSVNLQFQAEYPPNSGVYAPINQLNQLVSGTTQTNFNGGFYYSAVAAPATNTPALWQLALALSAGAWLAARRKLAA